MDTTSAQPASQRDVLQALGLLGQPLKERVALVTGAARGIGEHLARTLARLGARVVLADVAEAGEAVALQIREAGGEAHFLRTDVGDAHAVDRLVAATQALAGPVDVLVNNAAQLEVASVLEHPAGQWQHQAAVNLLGPVNLVQQTVPGMLARRRGVVLSLISLEGMPFLGSYCASKVALRSMMLSLGKEIPAGSGVSVFSVMPGAVDTPLAQEMIRSFAARLGLAEAEVRARMSNNPGYPGLVPSEHAAASLAWFIVNAAQFHGQFVDGFLPLSQAGVIDVGEQRSALVDPALHACVVPDPARDMRQLIEVNRSLENRIHERTRELAEINERLRDASLTDPLTGLWNRRYADLAMRDEIAAAQRHTEDPASRVHLLLIDLDDFKRVNDRHGHGSGDLVLREMADILRSQCRVTEKIIRWGGEEFLITARNIPAGQIEGLAERIRLAVASHPFVLADGTRLRCTCSIGFSVLTLAPGVAASSWESIVSVADLCMYAAKHSGRNRWVGLEIPAGSKLPTQAPPTTWLIPELLRSGQLQVRSSEKDPAAIRWRAQGEPG